VAIDPVTTYAAKIFTKGVSITGDVRSGMKANVPYLVSWANSINFALDCLSAIYTYQVGQVTYTLPYRFPGISRPPMYAHTFSIEPMGASETTGTYQGLAPGEYWTHAKVVIGFETLASPQQGSEDPQNLHQLDPNNPITKCEQSVKQGGKIQTRKGLQYRYEDDDKPVEGNAGVLIVESKLILKFPEVPYLPWQLLRPYLGTVNDQPILGCDRGTLLLEGSSTDAKPSLNTQTGVSTIVEAIVLEFAHQKEDWNKLPKPDGTTQLVYLTGDSARRIYEYRDFREIFNTLSFVQAE
jgi:hypothetical protein